jgi:phage portal protein BeeE
MRIHHSKAEQMLRWPSRWVTGYKLWSDLATDRMLYDLFCVMFIKGINGQDDRLVRIPPRMLEIKLDFLGQLVQVILRTPAGEDDVDITDAPIALSYGWHPNGNAGVSPLYTLSQLLLETRQAVEWRTSQWSNTPKISGILKRPETAPKWDATKRERFLQSWRTWRDTPKAGGTPLLEDGMTYETLEGVAPSDAKDIEGRMLTDVEVASAFHIPPELVGAREGNFSNIGAFRQMLFGPTLGPMFEDMQQAVNIGLIPHLETTDDTYVEINREAAINGSFLEQASLLQTLVGGPVMTRAEGRAKLNLPHLDGTDELIVPLNVTAGGQASPTDSGSQNVDLTNPK